MIRIRTHRRFSFLLIGAIVLSSLHYSVNVHYCNGTFAGISLIDSDKSCEMTSPCRMKAADDESKNCCENEKVYVDDLDVDYIVSTAVIQIDIQDVFHKPQALSLELSPYTTLYEWYGYHPPPPLDLDVQILFQTFLI